MCAAREISSSMDALHCHRHLENAEAGSNTLKMAGVPCDEELLNTPPSRVGRMMGVSVSDQVDNDE